MEPISAAMALAQFVPTIIKWLTGSDKAEAVANDVVEVAKKVTGTDTSDAALIAIQADPQKALEFRKAVMDNALEYDRIYLADVQNARGMQVAALGQDDLFSKRFIYYFASVWSLFSMGYFSVVTFATLPAAGQRVADTILGVLITSVLGSMIAYFYGSTKGSAEKTRIIAASNQAPK